MARRNSVRVGIASRIDFFSPGYRRGLVQAGFQVFEDEKTHFNVLQGGLVSSPSLKKLLKRRYQAAYLEWRDDGGYKGTGITVAELKEGMREQLIAEAVEELAIAIPVQTTRRGKVKKTYLVLSEALNYDGDTGYEVAHRLQKRRRDLIVWDTESARFRIDNAGFNDVWVVLPQKAAWRGEYFSTRVDRLVDDKERQSRQKLPGLWSSDCAAASMYRPQGALSRPRVSPPALHILQEITTSENQVGVAVMEIFEDSVVPIMRTYSFKDLTGDERLFIPNPDGANDIQLQILEQLRKYPNTVGQLVDAVGRVANTLEREIKAYNAAGLKPGIVFNKDSRKYDVDPRFLQKELTFTLPKVKDLDEERVLGFSCMHAGYRTVQYRWFVEHLPEIILREGITTLVGCGDNIAGLKHNLLQRGEVIGSMSNYTLQEKLAGNMVAEVMMRVFRARVEEQLAHLKGRKPSERQMRKIATGALLHFRHWRGNHDKWLQDLGYEPLQQMRDQLRDRLIDGVMNVLEEYGVLFAGIRSLVDEHLHYEPVQKLDSGQTMYIVHPEMGNTKTSSIRAESALKKAAEYGAGFVQVGNFHSSIGIHKWDRSRGQCIVAQNPTIASGTDFEDGKLKTDDTGVSVTKTYSKDGRIYMTEMFFEGPAREEMVTLTSDRDAIDLLDELGINVA